MPIAHPNLIANCVCCLLVEDLVLADQARIAQWTDSSGLGNHATQTNADMKPVYYANHLNGWPAIRVGDWVLGMVGDPKRGWFNLPDIFAGYDAATGVTAFIVLKAPADPGSDPAAGFWHFGLGAGSQSHYAYTNGRIYDGFACNGYRYDFDPAPALNVIHTYNISHKTGERISRINNSAVAVDGGGSIGITTTPRLANTAFDSYATMETYYWAFVAYKRVLTDQERGDVFTYLAKYQSQYVPPAVGGGRITSITDITTIHSIT